MRILYIVYSFPPVNIVAAQRAMFQAKYMAEAGADVTVICAEQTRKRDDPELLKQLEGVPNLSVHPMAPWGRDDQRGKQGFKPSAKGWFWVFRAQRLARKLHKKERFDVILSTYGPKYPHLTAYALNRMTTLPWVAEYRDPWVGNDHQNRNKLINQFVEKFIIKQSAALVTVSEGVSDILKSIHGQGKPVYIVYNGYDLVDKKLIKEPDSISDPLKLVIAGTVYPLQKAGVLELLKALQLLNGKAVLDYYGPSEKVIRESIEDAGIDAPINFHGLVSKAIVTEAISKADIAVLPASSVKGQLPVKFYDYLSLRKPVLMLGGQGSEIEQIMLATNSGVNAEAADEVIEFLDGIRSGHLNFSFTNADFYTRRQQAVRLLEVLNDVSDQAG